MIFTIRHILIIFSEISYVIQENMYKAIEYYKKQ